MTKERFDVFHVDVLALDEDAVRTITTLHQKTRPSMVQPKVRRIREVLPVPRTKLDEIAMGDANALEQTKQNTVFASL